MKYLASFLLLFGSMVSHAEVVKTVEFRVKLYLVDDYKDIPLNEGFNYEDGMPPYLGAAYIDKHFGDCEIWVKDPKGVMDFKHNEILGHELVHCYKGDYHSDPLRDTRGK